MSLTVVYRFVMSNVLTVVYCLIVVGYILFRKIVSLFVTDTRPTSKLVPPASLVDSQYGVHKYAKVNDIKLHYVESGDQSKPLMLFVHGFPEFWYSWRHQILNFKKDYWCVAIDLRGYADSERPEGVESYKLDILIKDIRELVRQLGREKFILVTHDWGGLIAAKYRSVYPETLLGVVLLASASIQAIHHEIWNNNKQKLKSWYVFFFRAPVLPEYFIQMNSMNDVFRKMMMVKGKDTVDENDIDCYAFWFGKPFAFTPPINYYRANFQCFEPEPKMCEKNVPMMLVHAKSDPFIEVNLVDRMKKEYKHIETVIVEGCGHFMQQEEPEKINKLIRDFLKKHNI